jgi:hypothetical protein
VLCAEKYLLNEHESAIIFFYCFYYFYHNFSVIIPIIFVRGNEQFLANINQNNVKRNVIFIVYLAYAKTCLDLNRTFE